MANKFIFIIRSFDVGGRFIEYVEVKQASSLSLPIYPRIRPIDCDVSPLATNNMWNKQMKQACDNNFWLTILWSFFLIRSYSNGEYLSLNNLR